jgi:flagellar basal-body rod modification protein FlgD
MEATSVTHVPTSVVPQGRPNAFNDLGSEDFLKLMVTQLTNQDPLEPTSNSELLEQISSIRNLELSTTLTDSLRTLTGQQRFASASSLIGQYVRGAPDESGAAVGGIVSAVRFEADGTPTLQLANGSVLRLEQLALIEQPIRVAEGLIGRPIMGLDRRNPAAPRSVEGLVTAVRLDERGEVILELDTGGDIRFRDVVAEPVEQS